MILLHVSRDSQFVRKGDASSGLEGTLPAPHSFLKDDDIGHSVHMCELFTVERRHQLPRSGLGGDEVLRQCHRGETADITGREGRM